MDAPAPKVFEPPPPPAVELPVKVAPKRKRKPAKLRIEHKEIVVLFK